MNTIKKISLVIALLLLCGVSVRGEKSSLQQRAEAADEQNSIASARFLFIRAFEEYAGKGLTEQGVECGIKATGLYYKENYYKEAFDLLHRVDDQINADKQRSASEKSRLHYLVTKERMQMYMKLRKSASAMDQLNTMEGLANASGDENTKNDLLYNKALYYYSFGQSAQGNAVFQEMASRLTAQKEYDKVDEVYQTLIANGRRSNSASLVAQSYSNYIAWKDSVAALKHADETRALKQQIDEYQKTIDDQASSLTARWAVIIGLCVLAAALAAVLILGGIVLMRYILLTRKQKKNIQLANDNNALKAKFISNISAQLNPTLHKLDAKIPEVQALLQFSEHISTLSDLENSMDEEVELEEVQLTPFCEQLMDEIRDKVKADVTLKVNVPNMSAKINKEYVSHILSHLLNNAAIYTPREGTIWLEYKKRGAHVHQFLVADSGEGIPEEKRTEVFKPFTEVKDFTEGDGLGLPICKQMALKMKGDLDVDPEFTKGTRFVLLLHS